MIPQLEKHVAMLGDLAGALQAYTAEEDRRLREKYPTYAAVLEIEIQALAVAGGGFVVQNEFYGSAEEAEEARQTAIMWYLWKMDRELA